MTVHFDAIDRTNETPFEVHGSLTPIKISPYSRVGKRILDILFVVAAAPLALPIVLGVALVLLLQGQSPFFFQPRVGRNGRVFTMLKLRTMVANAEDALEELIRTNPEARDEWLSDQKLKCDPRVTPFGRFLRKSSIDELPQLWNVLVGDMSIVGPRPILPSQRDMYPGTAYYALKPGITGAWQITDRNHCEFRDRARFDEHYGATVSLASDLKIIFRTFAVVLRGTGY